MQNLHAPLKSFPSLSGCLFFIDFRVVVQDGLHTHSTLALPPFQHIPYLMYTLNMEIVDIPLSSLPYPYPIATCYTDIRRRYDREQTEICRRMSGRQADKAKRDKGQKGHEGHAKQTARSLFTRTVLSRLPPLSSRERVRWCSSSG